MDCSYCKLPIKRRADGCELAIGALSDLDPSQQEWEPNIDEYLHFRCILKYLVMNTDIVQLN